jgi:hypothetical protein
LLQRIKGDNYENNFGTWKNSKTPPLFSWIPKHKSFAVSQYCLLETMDFCPLKDVELGLVIYCLENKCTLLKFVPLFSPCLFHFLFWGWVCNVEKLSCLN